MTATEPSLDTPLFAEHVGELSRRWSDALTASAFDGALIAAGRARTYFLDDQAPTFRANPHLAQWLGDDDCEGSLILITADGQAQLFFHQPDDYWHQPPKAPDHLNAFMSIEVFPDPDTLADAAMTRAQQLNRVAFIGEDLPGNLPVAESNPAQLVNRIHYQRAYKTGFELACMREATRKAVLGHKAAGEAFHGGASEFEIHLRYLEASEQTEADVPYPNIVALNEHAGVLHYQHYDRQPPAARHSFLIDAGARHRCYASDVTRTYASATQATGNEAFAAVIADLDATQQELIGSIRIGQNYLALHEDMHQRLGGLLAAHGLVACSAEAAFELGITRTFLPHGLGHLLGIQTHDVGGQQTSPTGGLNAPPDVYPALRLTRTVESGQVFTIEPGIYFIPKLLKELSASEHAHVVNWDRVDAFLPHGGIRIEDNVLVGTNGVENLTRNAFANL